MRAADEDVGYTLMEHAPLRALNTFGVAAKARWLARVHDAAALPRLFADARLAGLPLLVLGEGSNVLFVDDYHGVVLRPEFRGRRVVGEDNESVTLQVAAGENWHALVRWTLAQNWNGLENLSLIPGSVGAAPIQNIGAYGVEFEQRCVAVHVYDGELRQAQRLSAAQCEFRYRDSRFKHATDSRNIVCAVELHLSLQTKLELGYAGVAEELAAMGVDRPSALDVSDAIIAIRQRKLPDPAKLGNAGSFFHNPQVDVGVADTLRTKHPSLPCYPGSAGRIKLGAAWMIEQCGFKGLREGDAAVHTQHALVLVNHGQASGRQILALAQRIQARVRERFSIDLTIEPQIVAQSPR